MLNWRNDYSLSIDSIAMVCQLSKSEWFSIILLRTTFIFTYLFFFSVLREDPGCPREYDDPLEDSGTFLPSILWKRKRCSRATVLSSDTPISYPHWIHQISKKLVVIIQWTIQVSLNEHTNYFTKDWRILIIVFYVCCVLEKQKKQTNPVYIFVSLCQQKSQRKEIW